MAKCCGSFNKFNTYFLLSLDSRLFFRKRIFHTLDEVRQTNTMFETKGKRKKRWEIIVKMHTIDVIDKCRIPKGD